MCFWPDPPLASRVCMTTSGSTSTLCSPGPRGCKTCSCCGLRQRSYWSVGHLDTSCERLQSSRQSGSTRNERPSGWRCSSALSCQRKLLRVEPKACPKGTRQRPAPRRRARAPQLRVWAENTHGNGEQAIRYHHHHHHHHLPIHPRPIA